MIVPAWQNARVLYQGSEGDLPESALLIHTDNGGTLVIQQEDRYITLSRASLPELIRELRRELPEKAP